MLRSLSDDTQQPPAGNTHPPSKRPRTDEAEAQATEDNAKQPAFASQSAQPAASIVAMQVDDDISKIIDKAVTCTLTPEAKRKIRALVKEMSQQLAELISKKEKKKKIKDALDSLNSGKVPPVVNTDKEQKL